MIRPLLLTVLLLGASPLQAQPAPTSSVRPGDDQLTCEQLAAESAQLQGELDAMTSEMNAAALQQIQAARAAQAASTATSIASSIPFIGGIIGQIGSAATGAAINTQQDRMLDLAERMMTRGTEISQRMNRVEILRAARCGTGSGVQVQMSEPPVSDEG